MYFMEGFYDLILIFGNEKRLKKDILNLKEFEFIK